MGSAAWAPGLKEKPETGQSQEEALPVQGTSAEAGQPGEATRTWGLACSL